jgi:hypothetical protein
MLMRHSLALSARFQVINNIHVLAKHVKAQGIGGEGVPAIEDSKRCLFLRPFQFTTRARRAWLTHHFSLAAGQGVRTRSSSPKCRACKSCKSLCPIWYAPPLELNTRTNVVVVMVIALFTTLRLQLGYYHYGDSLKIRWKASWWSG